jgi:hypothetical protein
MPKQFLRRPPINCAASPTGVGFVMYVGRTKSGKTFRNVGYLQAIECYFGAPSSFPSAASAA